MSAEKESSGGELSPDPNEQPDRRQFIKGASCAIGAAIGAVPMVAGVRVALDPLGKEGGEGDGKFFQLANLGDLKPGIPKKYSIFDDRKDKWTSYKNVPVGAVYLLKTSAKSTESDDANATAAEAETVIAFNTVCPHLGCFVDYRTDERDFFCPCHDSNFDLKGVMKKGVSPRGMDTLQVEIREESEIWVKFQHFKANTKDKVAIS